MAILVEHVAVWVKDLEVMREFYTKALGAKSGPLYQNPRTGFSSYFVSFGEGARVELMMRQAKEAGPSGPPPFGYAHLALRLGSRGAVDEAVGRLEALGVVVRGRPRVTGDGYYEALIEDPEGNPIELVE